MKNFLENNYLFKFFIENIQIKEIKNLSNFKTICKYYERKVSKNARKFKTLADIFQI